MKKEESAIKDVNLDKVVGGFSTGFTIKNDDTLIVTTDFGSTSYKYYGKVDCLVKNECMSTYFEDHVSLQWN